MRNLGVGHLEQSLVEDVVGRAGFIGDVPDRQLERIVKPTDYAYTIYTSGSTGKPKGVLCNHVGPINVIGYTGLFGQGVPGVDVVGCSAPITIDTVLLWVFWSSWQWSFTEFRPQGLHYACVQTIGCKGSTRR